MNADVLTEQDRTRSTTTAETPQTTDTRALVWTHLERYL